MAFLRVVLGFAYIDGNVDEAVLDELDRKYGVVLINDFARSGQESVPQPQIRLTDAEAEIVHWFEGMGDDAIVPLDDIHKHFSKYEKSELKKILDDLCDRGVLIGGDRVFQCSYCLYK
jgi:hypothetical protein